MYGARKKQRDDDDDDDEEEEEEATDSRFAVTPFTVLGRGSLQSQLRYAGACCAMQRTLG